MRVYLLRHGIAVDRTDPQAPVDSDRPLTPRGMEKTREAALGLRELGVKPSAVVSSPWLRALQTAEILCEVIGFPTRKIIQLDSLKGTSPAPDLFRDLAKLRAKEVVCVGHEPHLHQVIGFVLQSKAPVAELKKAGVACLELSRVSPPQGQLIALYPAKTLRMLGK